MKLAEALIERKTLKEHLSRLRNRMNENARVQEGDQPVEDPYALLTEAEETVRRLRALTVQINHTNNQTVLTAMDSRTLMAAIADRDMLTLRRGMLEELARASANSDRGYYVTRTEIKFVPIVDGAALQKQVDALAKEYRELDMQIQLRNFEVDLIE
jgi:hypothetical protein